MATVRRRVVVELGTAVRDARVLDTAADLAQWADAELAGLFVEDANLLRLCGLPFAAEIGTVSAAWRPLAGAEVERMLRRQADRVQRRLEEAARTMALHWSFEVRRGAALADLLASSGDVLVIAGTAQLPPRSGPARHAHDPLRPGRYGPVAVLVEAGAASARALNAARGLARRRAAELLVVVSGASDAGAGRHSPDLKGERVLRLAQKAMPEDLARPLSGAQALFWPASADKSDAPALESVRRLLDCPVLVVR